MNPKPIHGLELRSYAIFLLTLICIKTAFSVKPIIITSAGKSEIIENRGRWSIGPDDKLYDLAGDWEILSSSMDLHDSILLPFAWYGSTGYIELSKTFHLPSRGESNAWRLVIGGAPLQTRVIINGVNVESRRGKNLSFQINLGSRTLRFGEENQITLIVENTYKSAVPPVRGSIYSAMNYGGIHRGVYLVSSPLVRIDDITVNQVEDSQNGQTEVDIHTEIRSFEQDGNFNNSLESEYELSISISEEGRGVILNGNVDRITIPSQGVYRKNFRIAIPRLTNKLQTKDNPKYRALLTLQGINSNHQISTDFYLRSKSGVINNVRCINYVASNPINGPIIPQNNIDTDIRLLMETGANTVRITHSTQLPYFLDQCDRLGVNVFLELPVFQVPNGILSDDNFIRSCLDQMTTIIERDGRYSCVIGWGIGDGIEPPNNNNMLYYTRLTDLIHKLDDRPVYASINWQENTDIFPLDFSIIDQRAIKLGTGVKDLNINKKHHFLIGGVSSLILPGNFSGWSDPSSEISQANNIVQKLAQIENLNGCSGAIVGDFLDWRGNIPTISGPLMGTSNVYTAGLMTGSRQPRPAYRALKNHWNLGKNEPMPQGNYASVDGSVLIVVGMLLSFILIVMARQNNIFRFNIQRTFASPSGFFQDIRDHRYFQTGHSLLLAIFISGSLGLMLTGLGQAHRTSFALDWIIGYLFRSNILIEWIAILFWNPFRSIMFFWVLSLFWLWTLILQFKLTGLVMRRKCTLSQCIDMSVWSSVIIVGMLPIGLISVRLFSYNLGWLVILFLLVPFIWAEIRLLYVYTTFFRLKPIAAIWWWILPPTALFVLALIVLNKFHAIFIYWRFTMENIIR